MLIPSGIQTDDDHGVETREVKTGLYVATNAYEGTYSYFRRPDPSTSEEATPTSEHDQQGGNGRHE